MPNSIKLLFLILTFSINLAFAQRDSTYKKQNPLAFSLTVDYGSLIKNNIIFPPILHNSYSIELNFNRETTGIQAWQTLQSYPRLGAELIYTSIGNPTVFGNAFGALPTLQYTFTRKHRFRFYYELGTGLAYITKPYNLITNPENNITGSYINEVVVLRVGYELSLWQKSQLSPSFTFIHYSNGSARNPNIGLNFFNLGITYRFGGNEKTPLSPTRKQFRRDSLPPVSRGIHLQALSGIGFEGGNTPGGPEYHIYIANFSLVKYINHKNKISIGIDESYNIYADDYITQEEITGLGGTQYAASGTAIFAGYEWLCGHIGIAAHIGPYLKEPFQATSKIFENMGIQYYLFNPITHTGGNLFIGAHVQTYFGQASYDDAFIGVSF